MDRKRKVVNSHVIPKKKTKTKRLKESRRALQEGNSNIPQEHLDELEEFREKDRKRKRLHDITTSCFFFIKCISTNTSFINSDVSLPDTNWEIFSVIRR